jgi:hypothetical protein
MVLEPIIGGDALEPTTYLTAFDAIEALPSAKRPTAVMPQISANRIITMDQPPCVCLLYLKENCEYNTKIVICDYIARNVSSFHSEKYRREHEREKLQLRRQQASIFYNDNENQKGKIDPHHNPISHEYRVDFLAVDAGKAPSMSVDKMTGTSVHRSSRLFHPMCSFLYTCA